MGAMRDRAKQVVLEYRRSGAIAPGHVAVSGFGDWSRLTPGWILFAALRIEILARHEGYGDSLEKITGDLRSPLPFDLRLRLVHAVMGDLEELRRADEYSVVTLENVTSLVSVAWADRERSEADIDDLLVSAEELAADSVRLVDGTGRWARGRDVGPWDVREVGASEGGRVDLGGLLVPGGPKVRLDPMYARDGVTVVAVTLLGERTALQLQAFRATAGRPWDVVRGQLRDAVIASGGTAAEWAGAVGGELRAEQPVRKQDGSLGVMTVRFIGSDGPGWLLRGTISGDGAGPGSAEDWPYDVFRDTVVNAGFSQNLASNSMVALRWPPEPSG